MVAAWLLAASLLPAGPERILGEVRRPGAAVVVLNVWATWCQPCREEFPDLLRLEREYRAKGVRLVLVSADFPDAVAEAEAFLRRHGVAFQTFLKDGDVPDQAFIDGLDPRWSGALPATIVFDGAGRKTAFWEGKADYATLERHVKEALNP
ncbi:MAG TPA: TlpA disulfide reductase family protein [Candidatus Polarisedimenticolaceae bacterium]